MNVNPCWRTLLSPITLYRTTSPRFGRGHVLAEQLDSALFRGITFGDLAQLTNRPYLIVGATDLSTGAEFNFTSDRLALLCSSVDQVPLAFAVAASNWAAARRPISTSIQ